MSSSIEFNRASFELTRFEAMLINHDEGNRKDILDKKLELIDKYYPLLDDEKITGYMDEYGKYLSNKLKENNIELYK